MHYQIISQSPNNHRIIFIFLGWAMDATPFQNLSLSKPGFDIAIGFHYTSLEKAKDVFESIISSYNEVSVIAWSYGVGIANQVTNNPKVVCRIAINGTTTPVDNISGIPPRYHNLTLKMLSAANLAKFYQLTGIDNLPLPCRTIDDLKEELQLFGNLDKIDTPLVWKKAYISMCDAIFPPTNQINAWTGNVSIEQIENGKHYVPFDTIIENDIIDKELIALRFTENASLYDSHASIQKAIALRLNELWASLQDISGKKILELGTGTGFLSRGYSSKNISTESVAVDLIPTEILSATHSKNGFNFPGKLVCDDAEHYVETIEDNTFDAIVSASTIQWFNDLPRFFKNIERILKPGGIAAIATFAEGTYAEIKAATGRSLTYPTADYFKYIMPVGLKIHDLITDEIKMEFADSRHLLNHIRETGVNAVGSPTPPGVTRRFLSYFDKDPHLTYKPLYMTIIKQ